MTRANLNKSERPESASIEIPPFRPHFINFSKTVSYEANLTLQCSHLEELYKGNLSLKGKSIDADSVPLRYAL